MKDSRVEYLEEMREYALALKEMQDKCKHEWGEVKEDHHLVPIMQTIRVPHYTIMRGPRHSHKVQMWMNQSTGRVLGYEYTPCYSKECTKCAKKVFSYDLAGKEKVTEKYNYGRAR